MPSAGSRLAGEREYAFKHVLIRDVAYSTLPKAVRARRHAEVGAFISGRAADRSEGVVAMVAEHYGRAASARRRGRPRAGRAGADRRPGAGRARGGRRRVRRALLQPRGAGPLRDRARARGGGSTRRSAPGSPRSSATSRCASAGSSARCAPGRRRSSTTAARRTSRGSATCIARSARGSGTRAIARARSSTTSAASTCSRTGRRASSSCGCTRRRPRSTCTPATTCSRSTPRRRRCGSPSASARRPPQAAPTGSSAASSGASATRERARENLERSVELARESDPAEAVRALNALGYHLEVSEADYEGAGEAYGAALDLALETGDLPSQVEIHAALAQLAVYRGDWEAGRAARPRRRRCSPSARAWRASSASRTRCAACCAGTRATSTAPSSCSSAPSRSPSRSGARRSRSSRCTGWRSRCGDRGDHADADQALARALDLCERAGLVAQSVEATAARAVNLAALGWRRRAAREVAEEAESLAERLRYPVGAAASLEAMGAAASDPTERAELLARGAAKLGGARPADRRRALRGARRAAATGGSPLGEP